MNTNELSTLDILAVSRAVSEEVARGASWATEPGAHPVDITVRVRGTITKGEDYTQRIVAKAEPWTLLALALSHLNGVTVESLVREAAAREIDPKEIKAAADTAIQEIKAATVTTCTGKVRADLYVSRVSATGTDTASARGVG